MNNIATSEILDLAADAIGMGGWAKGADSWDGGNGGLCLEGGIAAAMGINVDSFTGAGLSVLHGCPAYHAVKEYLAPFIADVNKSFAENPWYFNDAIAETAEDVIVVLRAAAAIERLKESPAVYETEDQPLPISIAA